MRRSGTLEMSAPPFVPHRGAGPPRSVRQEDARAPQPATGWKTRPATVAAYFKGQRTEREARAALKIIKAFVRDRERRDAAGRAPMPGAVVKAPKRATKRKTGSERGERTVRKPHRTLVLRSAKATSVAPAIAPETTPDLPPSTSHENTSD
jgi:hypothetical protein